MQEHLGTDAGKEDVLITVIVVIERHDTNAGRQGLDLRLLRGVVKMAVAVIEIKIVAVDSADEQVNESVVVKISGRGAMIGEAIVASGAEHRQSYGEASRF